MGLKAFGGFAFCAVSAFMVGAAIGGAVQINHSRDPMWQHEYWLSGGLIGLAVGSVIGLIVFAAMIEMDL